MPTPVHLVRRISAAAAVGARAKISAFPKMAIRSVPNRSSEIVPRVARRSPMTRRVSPIRTVFCAALRQWKRAIILRPATDLRRPMFSVRNDSDNNSVDCESRDLEDELKEGRK